MRTSIHYILLIAAICFAASCKKDGEQYELKSGSFSGNTLSASASNIVLASSTENDTALVYQWQAADYGQQPVITYTLQLARPADTANNWASAKTITISTGSLRYAFIGKDLNSLLNSMGLTAGAANTVAARIRADVNQMNGTASTIPSVYSNTVLLQITSYATALYVPGDYQGWAPATAPQLAPVEGKAGLFEGYVYMAGSGTHYFKYTNAPDWDHTNYGDGGSGSFSTDGAAAGLSVPDGGYYYLTANLNNNTWTATKVVWGILGDATPGGWNTDTHLTYNETSQVWEVTAAMIKNGSFKFRANDAWSLDFGIDANGNLAYADNPFLGYTAGLGNLTVPEDGTYKITLDLHTPGEYTYSLQKQ